MPAGRPTKYDPSWMHDKVIEMMKEGASKVEVAAALGIDRDTLREWTENYPEFSVIMKKGQGLSESWWTTQGRIALREDKFNHVLWMMNMKTRFRETWSDSQKHIIESKSEVNVKGEIEISNIDDRIEQLINGAAKNS